MARQPQECLLDDVLGSIAVIDEEARQSDERPTLGAKQLNDQLLSCVADHLALLARDRD